MDENSRVDVRRPSVLIIFALVRKTMPVQTSIVWMGGRTFAVLKKCKVLVGVGPAIMVFFLEVQREVSKMEMRFCLGNVKKAVL